jgi:hypothetical protein
MAAGMGSRYGGPKQIDPVTDKGEIILDFSLYDAMMAGFIDVVFIIKREIEADARALIDNKAGKHLNITYVFQDLDDLPEGYAVPSGREKPWGTCHAVMAARKVIDGPFAVINADDYYGSLAFHIIYDELLKAKDTGKYSYSMVGYELAKTLTENGHVARGVCRIGADGNLAGVDERTKIARRDGKIKYTEDDIQWIEVPEDSVVSMNLWGFTPSIMKEMIDGFPSFLDGTLPSNPLKGEYLLPMKVDELIQNGKAEVKVLSSPDRWYGITYKEDKQGVVDALQALKDKGEYPDELFK